MANFAVVSEGGVVLNIIVAESFEEADALTTERLIQSDEARIGDVYLEAEERFVDSEEFNELMADTWQAVEVPPEALANAEFPEAEAENVSEPVVENSEPVL